MSKKDNFERTEPAEPPQPPPIEAAPVESDPFDTEGRDWRELTVNGFPIPEQNWPRNRWGLPGMVFRHTDQGIKEWNEAEKRSTNKVRVGDEKFEKSLLALQDARNNSMPWLDKDPMKSTAMPFETPGMSQRYLSEATINSRGDRGYQVVKDKNGDPVRCGKLILAEIPNEIVERRNAYFAEKSAEFTQRADQPVREVADRAKQEGGLVNLVNV